MKLRPLMTPLSNMKQSLSSVDVTSDNDSKDLDHHHEENKEITTDEILKMYEDSENHPDTDHEAFGENRKVTTEEILKMYESDNVDEILSKVQKSTRKKKPKLGK
jgi:hypothetical protein